MVKLFYDEKIILEFGHEVLKALDYDGAKKFVVGLVNNHFSAMAHRGYEVAVVENFLFLLYAFNALGLPPSSDMQKKLILYARDSMSGIVTRNKSETNDNSIIINHLKNYTIRI